MKKIKFAIFIGVLAVITGMVLGCGGGTVVTTTTTTSTTTTTVPSGSWHALGGEVGSSVYALAIDGSNNLYVGGAFIGIDTLSARRIAKWNGSSWAAVGDGFDGAVHALKYDTAGNTLYATGNFGYVGLTGFGLQVHNIAKWTGSAWQVLGLGLDPGVASSFVEGYGLAYDAAHNYLYVGGWFVKAGSVSLVVNNIAKWNGSAWSALGAGLGNSLSSVNAVVVDSSGNVYAAGDFSSAGGVSVHNIAKWNGTSWEALGSGLDDTVHALAIDSSGNLYAGGDFTTAGGVAASHIALWNGSSWSAVGGGVSGGSPIKVLAFAFDSSDNLYVGGLFTAAGGISADNIAVWNGTSWFALGSGVNNSVKALAVDSAGNVYAGGEFLTAGGVAAKYIARWGD